MCNKITYEEIFAMLCLSLLIYNYNENNKFIFKINQTLLDFYNNIDYSFDIYQREALSYLKDIIPNGKMLKFIDNVETDIQLGIIENDIKKSLAIVFRGTDAYQDWLYDCTFCKTKLDDDVRVHSGFYNHLMSVYDEIIEVIDEFLIKDYNIYICGHSLGGGESLILSYLLSKKTSNLIKVITFGAPKVGNYYWKQKYESITNVIHYRITNKTDIITKLPINYYHVGINIHIYEDKMIINNDEYIIFHNIFDHLITSYYNNFYGKKILYDNLIINNIRDSDSDISSDSENENYCTC